MDRPRQGSRPGVEDQRAGAVLVEEVARDPGPGQAVLYGTTRSFLEKLGLDTLEDLPPLGDFVPGPEMVEALEQGLRPEA